MKEGKIRNVRDFEMNVPGEKRKTSVSQLESRIVFAEDSVSAQEIKEYAELLAWHIKKLGQWEDSVAYVLDALSESRVFDLVALHGTKVGTHELSDEEIAAILKPIRKKILEELANYLDPDEYFFIVKEIVDKKSEVGNAIYEIEGHPSHGAKVLRDTGAAVRIDHEAIRIFGSIEESHPAILDIDFYHPQLSKMICKKLHIVTLKDLFDAEELKPKSKEKIEKNYSVSQLFKIVLDTMEGALFLVKHGLMMQDISPDNIGILTQTDSGIFFDVEGLCRLGISLKSRLHKDFYLPPELYDFSDDITHEKEMVFQFGKVLQNIIDHTHHKIFGNTFLRALNLYTELTHPNPNERCDLQTAYNKVKNLKEELEQAQL